MLVTLPCFEHPDIFLYNNDGLDRSIRALEHDGWHFKHLGHFIFVDDTIEYLFFSWYIKVLRAKSLKFATIYLSMLDVKFLKQILETHYYERNWTPFVNE